MATSHSDPSDVQLPRFDWSPRILIVSAPYYHDIAQHLFLGAQAAIERSGAAFELVEVPGALELPPAIAIADAQKHYNGYVALGCVIRGETSHYDTVCNESARGLMELGLRGVAIGNGILTVENKAQAEFRADPAQADKGGGAAIAALHLVALAERFNQSRSHG